VALTKVAPALFGTGNNITSVTVGGSANTISLTFDGSGVITSATNNAVSVANTAITGNIISSQITSVANTQITGNIISSQITSVANTQITGNITAAQITSVANTQLTGLIQAAQIGSANATLITSGTLPGARLPANSIIQVVSATLSGSFSTGSTTPNGSGLTATITPQFSSSKIFITCCLGWTHKGGGSAVGPVAYHYVYRQINGGGYSNLQLITIQGSMSNGSNGGDVFGGSIAYSYIDSPNTTTAVNYQIYMASSDTGTNIYMGENNAACNIIVMEIKQ
jgi:hypothetical protein